MKTWEEPPKFFIQYINKVKKNVIKIINGLMIDQPLGMVINTYCMQSP